MYIPEKRKNRQITLFDFNQSCGKENPYLQYFIGMEKFRHKAPIKSSVLVSFRKRRAADYLMEVNEYILEISDVTKEHEPQNESRNAKAANTFPMTLKILAQRFLIPQALHPT